VAELEEFNYGGGDLRPWSWLATPFDDNDGEYLGWLDKHPDGFVLNVSRRSMTFDVVMHRGTCAKARDTRNGPGALTERGYIKICYEDSPVLEGWSGQYRPRAKLRRCKYCLPQQEIQSSAREVTANSAYWWVNHKQTHRAELDGGYIWRPKVKSNGGRNQSYDNLTLVQPGDTVISYADGKIKAIGVAIAIHREEGKPEEFGSAGGAWNSDGWLVPVNWQLLVEPIVPKAHLEMIGPLLPKRHSPIREETGDGNHGVYLAAISHELGQLLVGLAGQDGQAAIERGNVARADAQADQAEAAIVALPISSTEKEQLVIARRGQGAFRLNVSKIEKGCRLTGTTDKRFLIASHIKPWAASDNVERLDGHNGLLLAPHVDRLFDGGWISFGDDGELLFASSEINSLFSLWGVSREPEERCFSDKQRFYLTYHRARVFKLAMGS